MSQRNPLRNRSTLRSSSYGSADPLRDAPTRSAFESFCRSSTANNNSASTNRLKLILEEDEESAYSLQDSDLEEVEDEGLISQSLLSSPVHPKRENSSNTMAITRTRQKPKPNYNFSKMMTDQLFQSPPPPPSRRNQKKPLSDHTSEAESSNDETCKERFRIFPLQPTNAASSTTLESVAGLDGCIAKLKEMVTFPLLYPEFYQRIGIAPPRGILFHGPPGTGKTLVARALANFCTSHAASHQPISFYVRNGGDCLSKYIGEAEKSIRLLFAEARKNQPSIIFFDEIDAIAPARTNKSEQSHVSVVATLLSEMDGLSDRGQIVVIGATNRLQSLDPALRRPGRFDREFYFPMPGKEARKGILQAHTRQWGLHESIAEGMAEITQGYSGSDIKGLCLEAATKAFNRKILSLPTAFGGADWKLDVSIIDFMDAYREIVPSSVRHSPTGISASKHSKILVDIYLGDILRAIRESLMKSVKVSFENLEVSTASMRTFIEGIETEQFRCFRPRIVVRAAEGMLSDYVVVQSLGLLEEVYVHHLDLLQLYASNADAPSGTPESAMIRILNDARCCSPSILFIPQVVTWWDKLGSGMQDIFCRFVKSLHPRDPILILCTDESGADGEESEFHLEFPEFFKAPSTAYTMKVPSAAHRRMFFHSVFQRFRFDTGSSFGVLEQEIVEFNRRAEEKLQDALVQWKIPREKLKGTFKLLECSGFKTCSDMEAFLGQELDAYFASSVTQQTDYEFHSSHYRGEAFRDFMHQQLFQIDAALIMKLEDLNNSKMPICRMQKRTFEDSLGSSGGNTQVLLDDCVVGKLVEFVTGLTDSFTLEKLELARTEIERYGIHRDNKFLFQEFERYMKRVFC